jgi:hypothetical protein
MLVPLFSVNQATFTVDAGKALDVKVRFQAANERQANLVAQSAKTLLAALEASVEKTLPEQEKTATNAAEAEQKKEARESIAVNKALKQMAGSARVDSRFTDVTLSIQVNIEARQLIPMLNGMMFWRNERPRVQLSQN